MSHRLVLSACAILLLVVFLLAVLATCYHRVVVVEGISGNPIPGAYITLERLSGSSAQIGQTDAGGRLAFWSAPLPLPRLVCAQSTFYPPACVSAIGLGLHRIELAVPSGTP